MKFLVLVLALSAILLTAGQNPGYADTFSFQPTPSSDLYDLDHWYNYSWGINWSVPEGQQITGASIFFDNINDWTVESGDILYVHLLGMNNAVIPIGVISNYDGQVGGDNFLSSGPLLFTYSDDDSPSNPAEDLLWNFTVSQLSELTIAAANGNFGLGFDPDCHYYNDGVAFRVETSVVPEPTTLALLGIGLVGLARRFRRKNT